MHVTNTLPNSKNNFTPDFKSFDFLWLELTSRCNLECIHCYADSSPIPKEKDKLTPTNYFNLISEASQLGCHKIQFIGGEPTIVKELPDLITFAKEKGFDFIEVYTNAVYISDKLLSCFVENNVKVAASFYSFHSEVHDSITTKKGSFHKTSNTIKRLVDSGIDLRVGIIAMEENKDHTDNTIDYLRGLGVKDVGVDRMRSFGRGSRENYNNSNAINELCGSCWQGSLCVFPDGKVAPCIMSKNWNVGSILENSLEEILTSLQLNDTRMQIYNEVWLPASNSELPNYQPEKTSSEIVANCMPKQCQPQCSPRCSPSCQPCFPFGKCNPRIFG